MPRDYWLLEDYVARNPGQAALTTDFARSVQEPARAFEGPQQGPVRIVMVYRQMALWVNSLTPQ